MFLTPLADPLHRHEFGPPKFFSGTFKFSMIFCSTWQISGANDEKHADPGKKNRNSQQLRKTVGTC